MVSHYAQKSNDRVVESTDEKFSFQQTPSICIFLCVHSTTDWIEFSLSRKQNIVQTSCFVSSEQAAVRCFRETCKPMWGSISGTLQPPSQTHDWQYEGSSQETPGIFTEELDDANLFSRADRKQVRRRDNRFTRPTNWHSVWDRAASEWAQRHLLLGEARSI